MTAVDDIDSARGRALRWWQALASRDRMLLALSFGALTALLLWWFAVAPAWRTISRAPVEIEAAERQLMSMQRLAAEARELRSTPPVNAEQSGAALKAAAARLGDKARLSLQGDRAVLTLTGVGGTALRDFLAEVRSGARARPVEASLTRGSAGLSGSLVLALGGAGAAP